MIVSCLSPRFLARLIIHRSSTLIFFPPPSSPIHQQSILSAFLFHSYASLARKWRPWFLQVPCRSQAGALNPWSSNHSILHALIPQQGQSFIHSFSQSINATPDLSCLCESVNSGISSTFQSSTTTLSFHFCIALNTKRSPIINSLPLHSVLSLGVASVALF